MGTDTPTFPIAAASRHHRFAMWALLLLALAVRLPGLNRPLLGNFATRNVVQAMAARNWVRGDAPWWRPTLDCLADGEPAWHLVEVPCSAYLSGAHWSVFGDSLDAWGRATSIGWSLISVALLYRIVERRLGLEAATGAGFVMAFSPIAIIYGQSFLLEPSVVALMLAAWWGTDRFLETHRWRWWTVIALSLAFLWLTKIYMLALAAPLIALTWQQDHTRRFRWIYVATLAVAVLPTAWWCAQVWRLAGPHAVTADRVFYSFLGSAAEHRFPHPLLFTLDFPRRLLIDLFTVVLTPLGAFPLFFALRCVEWRRWWPTALVMAALVLVMPRKFYEMNYYQLLFLPVWGALVGLGWKELLDVTGDRSWLRTMLVAASLLCAARYSIRPAFITPEEDRSVVAAAEALQRVAGPKDRVVTSHGSTLDLLYYCDRRGWALPLASEDFAAKLESFRKQGARWLVIAGVPLEVPDGAVRVLEALELVEEGVGFRVYRLSESPLSELRPAASTAMPNAPGSK